MLKSSEPKSSKNFHCELCDFSTSRNSQYQRHISTPKHKNQQMSTNGTNLLTKINNKSSIFSCICGKIYKERTGLWKHKKKCNNITQHHTDNNSDSDNYEDSNSTNNILNITDKEIIAMLLKENSDFKTMLVEQQSLMMEMIKNGTHNTTNNTNNSNSHNKTFNLNFFLNEQCKDAMNIIDFVSSLKIELDDIETTGRVGFVEGISKLIMKNLRALDTFKRPIHCSDLKRETMYIKDNNKWEKDNEDKDKIKGIIKDIANENIKQISSWTKKYPDCREYDSRKNDMYLKIVTNSMSGGTVEETQKNIDNIVRNIAKEVVIGKDK